MEADLQPSALRGRIGGLSGVGSLVLLAAAVRWAHHWGPVADTIVVAWAIATVVALATSVWALRTARASRWMARFGVTLAIFSLLALCTAGLLYAAGIDTTGACGGG